MIIRMWYLTLRLPGQGKGPIKFLGKYSAFVQADAYSGYDEFFRKGKATEVGCNAHARRKFEYAMGQLPCPELPV